MAEHESEMEQYASWKAPEAKNETEQGAQPIDIRQGGAVKFEKLGVGTGEKGLSAEHEVVTLSSDLAGRYDKQRAVEGKSVDVTVGGKIYEDGKLAETYRNEYVQLPDGKISGSRVESTFGDGSVQVLERKFDAQGRRTSEQLTLDGKMKKELVISYGPDGKTDNAEYVDYDDQGKEVSRKKTSTEFISSSAVYGEVRVGPASRAIGK